MNPVSYTHLDVYKRQLYDFKYKVVFDKPSKVEAGTEVRCLNPDGSIRGVGVAKSPLETNYFSYRVIWLE